MMERMSPDDQATLWNGEMGQTWVEMARVTDQLLGLVADQVPRPRRGVEVAPVGVVAGHHLTERVGEELKTVELGGRPRHVDVSVALRSGFRTKPGFYRFWDLVL